MVRKKKTKENQLDRIASVLGISPEKGKKEKKLKSLTLKQIGGTLKARRENTARKILSNPMSSQIEKMRVRSILKNGT